MLKFLPWRFLVKHAARRYGVLDPASLLAKLRGFAQPSEVGEPLELLRAGIVFHARGLVNSKAIQHNLDWVWPFWVERQFNPADPSFIPRAFSFSHINLTHRNWTAVGQPGMAVYPIVDPRGLVTPLHDGWSLDFWIITADGSRLLPSKLGEESVSQVLEFAPNLQITTRGIEDGRELKLVTSMEPGKFGAPEAVTRIAALSATDAWLAVAIRPYNPEGVQFIDRIVCLPSGNEFRVNDEATVRFDRAPDRLRMAHYAEGDVSLGISAGEARREISCAVGMATASAMFQLKANQAESFEVAVTLERDLEALPPNATSDISWADAVAPTAKLRIGDSKMQFLYDAAIRTPLLLSAHELVPGPYTYRRFWFRDACLMLHPLMVIGLMPRAERILATFAKRQTMAGYFQSQEGEWDSNGQVLWIAARHAELTGGKIDAALETALRRAVGWLAKKRLTTDVAPGTRGLLPAGFSAEHLGPNDYYYWDDFWAWGGLRAIADYWEKAGANDDQAAAAKLAGEFAADISRSIASIPEERGKGAIPAAPGRRMDAGAVGSLVADYPLKLYPAGDPKILRTLDFLMATCFSNGGFFQQMIHSGVNAYLTLDLAQTLMRAGDNRFMELIRSVARLASPTGQWPEAIHPRTLGGCMGDGQHGWAAAEWIMMIRNCFVREEGDELVIGSGILPEWGGEIEFGPTLTPWGNVTVRLADSELSLTVEWRGPSPRLRIEVPGFVAFPADAISQPFRLEKL